MHNRGCVFTPELQYRDFPKSLSEIPGDLGRITSIGAPISRTARDNADELIIGCGTALAAVSSSSSSWSAPCSIYKFRELTTAQIQCNFAIYSYVYFPLLFEMFFFRFWFQGKASPRGPPVRDKVTGLLGPKAWWQSLYAGSTCQR